MRLDVRQAAFFGLTGVLVLSVVIRYGVLMLGGGTPEEVTVPADRFSERGMLFDRNGRILGISVSRFSLTAWKPTVADTSSELSLVAPLVQEEPETLLRRYDAATGPFLYLARDIGPEAADELTSLMDSQELPGFALVPTASRAYPNRSTAGNLIGFVGTDGAGLAGVEESFNSRLTADDVYLSIDLNIQAFAENEVRNAVEEYQAERALMVVLDPRTMEVLAAATSPGYDPNRFEQYSPEDFGNAIMDSAFEPGSVMKVFSLASVMDLGGITPYSVFYCDGAYRRSEPDGTVTVIRCLSVHGPIGVADTIRYSCNAGAAYASDTVEAEPFYNRLVAFGFGGRTGIRFPGENSGILSSPGKWTRRSKPTIAIGQEIAVTPIQIVTAAAALVNDGVVYPPRLVRNTSPLSEGRRAVSPETADTILNMMEASTYDGGTGVRTRINGVRVGTKTGTAQIYDADSGTYSDSDFTSSTLSILPLDDPQLVIYVAIQKPHGEVIYGGRIAAPLVRRTAEWTLRYLGTPIGDDSVLPASELDDPAPQRSMVIADIMPDLSGWSKREVLSSVGAGTYPVEMTGNGWVTDQFPPPGTALHEGDILHFSFGSQGD